MDVDMLTMMMQMEKSPDFCDQLYHNTSTYIPETDHSTGTNSTFSDNYITNSSPIPNFNIPNQVAEITSLTPLLNPSNSSVSFMGNPIQEPITPPHSYDNKNNSMSAMREMIFRIAAMQPIHIDPESIKPPKRRNVKISKDPQSVAARQRRERISEKIRILQRLVPGGTKMDTASMLDEAIHYVKFLKKQIQTLEQLGANRGTQLGNFNYSTFVKACQTTPPHQLAVGSMQMLR